jgi:hypothetical protein
MNSPQHNNHTSVISSELNLISFQQQVFIASVVDDKALLEAERRRGHFEGRRGLSLSFSFLSEADY